MTSGNLTFTISSLISQLIRKVRGTEEGTYFLFSRKDGCLFEGDAYVREGAYSKKYGEFLSFLYYIYYSTTSNCWSYIFGLKTDSWQCRLVGKKHFQNSKQKQLLCFAINFVVCLLWVSWLRWFCELHVEFPPHIETICTAFLHRKLMPRGTCI